MSGSIPLPPIYAFKACTKINLPVRKSGEIDQSILSSGTGREGVIYVKPLPL
jgi:hypothetical protein